MRLVLALVLLAGAAAAGAPETSLRPPPRPDAPDVGMAASAPLHLVGPLAVEPTRPRLRPFAPGLPGRVLMLSLWPPVPAVAQPRPRSRPARSPDLVHAVAMPGVPGLPASPWPRARPDVVPAAAVRAQPDPGVVFGRRGALCGVDAIKGTRMSPIAGKLAGCGVAEPVQVTSVQGVALSVPAVMDCPTARALDAWVKGAVLPQVGRLGGGVARLEVASSYVCRPRNNRAGQPISEHGRGQAIDISGITLRSGQTIGVLKGWADRSHGSLLKALHKAACGPFGTVLGPASDGYHRDHFHLDTARYRSGSWCR